MTPRIRDLLEQVKEAAASEENQRKLEIARRHGRLELVERAPIYNELYAAGFLDCVLKWRELLSFDLDLGYLVRHEGPHPREVAEKLVEFQLLQKLYQHREIGDDTPLGLGLATSLGLSWFGRPDFFGQVINYQLESGAWTTRPLIRDERDLERLEIPHYPYDEEAHRARVAVFEKVVEGELPIADDGLAGPMYAPFKLATHLRGVLELMLDLKDRPGFVHRLMEFVVKAVRQYNGEYRRARKVAVVAGAAFGCDEVDCDLFSPRMYEEFVFPYEREAARDFAAIYYHSCGNLTPIFELIVQLPNLHKVQVSPWSDLATAKRHCANRVILQKHMHVVDDIHHADEEQMRRKAREIAELGTDYALEFMLPGWGGSKRFAEILREEIPERGRG